MNDRNDSTKNTEKTPKDTKNGQNTNSAKENQCPICLEQISNRCLTDTCRHQFCLNCLRHWSEEHNYCPVCRQVFAKILHNFRSENLFDSIDVNNRESNVRRSLITQRDSLRQQLAQIRDREEQQMQTLRQRIAEMDRNRDRINSDISRIDSIDRQNNDEIDRTLNDIRNDINEINFENFRNNPNIFGRTLMNSIVPYNPGTDIFSITPLPPLSIVGREDRTEANPGVLIEEVVDSPQNSTSADSMELINDSNPEQIEYQIIGPNSVQNITISSRDSDNGSVRSIRSVSVQQSGPEEAMNLNDMSEQNPLLFSGFEEMQNQMNQWFQEMLQSNDESRRGGSERFSSDERLNGSHSQPIYDNSSDPNNYNLRREDLNNEYMNGNRMNRNLSFTSQNSNRLNNRYNRFGRSTQRSGFRGLRPHYRWRRPPQ